MKRILFLFVACSVFGLFAKGPRYVFLFIGDGMSTPQRMIAEEFSRKAGSGPLAMNTLPCQAVTRTCSASSLVTDSAAAATAIACGVKTYNGAMGVDAGGRPVRSCAERAKAAGMKVGIVTTVTTTHATPAGFYAHRRNRAETYGIALDLADSGFDYFAGGGLDTHESKSRKEPEFAKCGEAYAYAESKGYTVVRSLDAFRALKPGCGRILTCFTNGALDYSIDATPERRQPTLAEMVAKGIELLDGPDGFFMMAEGGRIDWAGHSNDAATNLRDVLAFDDAVKVALGFLESHPDDTLVVVTGDHETGGMSMGFSGTGYALYMDRLAHQTMSVEKFDGMVADAFAKNPSLAFDDVKPLVEKAFGLAFSGDASKNPMVLSKAEAADIRAAFDHDAAFHAAKVAEDGRYDGEKKYLLGGACRTVLSHKSGIGWGSCHHTAMPVMTTAKGCGAERFSGFIENTQIAGILSELMVSDGR